MEPIYETENFYVDAQGVPFVSREDGGHLRIKVKDASITDRTKLDAKKAIELMRLSMVVGEAFEKAMNMQGIPVVKINYQDMGNWPYKEGKLPSLHYHVFGRAKGSVKQPFPEAVYLPDRSSGFYDSFEPLNQEDLQVITAQIKEIFAQEKYSDLAWGL